MKQNLESSFNLGNTTLLTQHFHSTLREKHVIYTLIYVRKFNWKVKFITQCTENIFTHENRQHLETTQLSLWYASLRNLTASMLCKSSLLPKNWIHLTDSHLFIASTFQHTLIFLSWSFDRNKPAQLSLYIWNSKEYDSKRDNRGNSGKNLVWL